MFLILFNLLLIGLYCLIGFLAICLIAIVWELIEKSIRRKNKGVKNAK